MQVAQAWQRTNTDPTLRISTTGPVDDLRACAQCLQCGDQVEFLSSFQAVMWCESHRCEWAG